MLTLNRSLLNKGYILMNVLKALAWIVSMYNLHVIFVSKIIPRYCIYRLDVPSIQRKRTIRRSNSMRKIDRLSVVFINFYIPTLTPDRY
jgi:hypothetical protein